MERLIKSLSAVIAGSSAIRSSNLDQFFGTVLEAVLEAVDGAVLGWICLVRSLPDRLNGPVATAIPHDSIHLAAVRRADKGATITAPAACPDCPCHRFITGTDSPPKYTVIDHCPHPTLSALSAGAHVCIPLFVQDRPIGTLNLAKVGSASLATTEELFLRTVANQLSTALENASLINEAQVRLQETQTLLDVSYSVNSTLDLQEAIRRIARAVARVLLADTTGAYLLDSDGGRLLPFAGYHLPKHLVDRLRRTPIPVKGFRFVEEALNTKAAVYTSDTNRESRVDHAIFHAFSCKSALFVPMLAKD